MIQSIATNLHQNGWNVKETRFWNDESKNRPSEKCAKLEGLKTIKKNQPVMLLSDVTDGWYNTENSCWRRLDELLNHSSFCVLVYFGSINNYFSAILKPGKDQMICYYVLIRFTLDLKVCFWTFELTLKLYGLKNNNNKSDLYKKPDAAAVSFSISSCSSDGPGLSSQHSAGSSCRTSVYGCSSFINT